MDHSMMNHSMHGMDHSSMDHSNMDHSSMDHSNMDHSNMDHSQIDHSQMDHSNMTHSMMMYFHFSVKSTILFEGWKTSSWQGMLGSCIAVFVMAALYEGLKVMREYLLQKSMWPNNYQDMPVPTTDNSAVTTINQPKPRMCSIAHGLQTILHIVQIVVSYFLMLIFMTYNGWLCIAVALGAGLGYFLFSWKRASIIDLNEHCH